MEGTDGGGPCVCVAVCMHSAQVGNMLKAGKGVHGRGGRAGRVDVGRPEILRACEGRDMRGGLVCFALARVQSAGQPAPGRYMSIRAHELRHPLCSVCPSVACIGGMKVWLEIDTQTSSAVLCTAGIGVFLCALCLCASDISATAAIAAGGRGLEHALRRAVEGRRGATTSETYDESHIAV